MIIRRVAISLRLRSEADSSVCFARRRFVNRSFAFNIVVVPLDELVKNSVVGANGNCMVVAGTLAGTFNLRVEGLRLARGRFHWHR